MKMILFGHESSKTMKKLEKEISLNFPAAKILFISNMKTLSSELLRLNNKIEILIYSVSEAQDLLKLLDIQFFTNKLHLILVVEKNIYNSMRMLIHRLTPSFVTPRINITDILSVLQRLENRIERQNF